MKAEFVNDKISSASDNKDTIVSLNKFVLDTKILSKLEARISKFNIFRVLKFVFAEIRHSNTLAWILNPEETHGLSDLFLRNWLMRIVMDSNIDSSLYPSPIIINTCEFVSIDVRREWHNIDLLILIETKEHGEWIVVIENKVHSTQSENQLETYEKRAKEYFPQSKYQIKVFLTKNNEPPAKDSYIQTNYELIYEVLDDCIKQRVNTIASEPLILLNHYMEILAEVFMEDSEIAKLARSIYKKHKEAIDVIILHKPDALADLTDYIHYKINKEQHDLRILPMPKQKGYVRFIPIEWNTSDNLQGDAWGKSSSFILFELDLWLKSPSLKITLGKPPKEWAKSVWAVAQNQPFNPPRKKKMPESWICIHSFKSRIPLDKLEEADIGELGNKIFNWLREYLQTKNTKKIISCIKLELENLNFH